MWDDRAALPAQPVYEHLAPFAVTPRADKLAAVRQQMKQLGASHHWISTLDDIAWLTNLRGADVSYNPVFIAHLLLDAKSATLFVAEGKVNAKLASRLAADGIALAPYDQAAAALKALPATANCWSIRAVSRSVCMKQCPSACRSSKPSIRRRFEEPQDRC